MFPPPVGVGAAVGVVHPAGVGDGVDVGMGSNAVGLVMPMVRGAVTDGVGRAVGNIVVTTGIGAAVVGVPTVGVFVKSPTVGTPVVTRCAGAAVWFVGRSRWLLLWLIVRVQVRFGEDRAVIPMVGCGIPIHPF